MSRRVVLSTLFVLLVGLVACRESGPEEALPTSTLAPTNTALVVEPTETAAPMDTPEPQATATEEAAEPPLAEEITLSRVENEAMGISVLVPEGWEEVAPGVYGRGALANDLTRLIQQAAVGTTTDQLTTALLPQLGIDALPEPSDALETDALSWDLYEVEVNAPPVGAVAVDMALAETENAAYVILLQTLPEERDALHEAVFLPAVQGLEVLDGGEAGAVYADPAGLFSVPVPTNWTVEESEGYVTLLGPEAGLQVHILTVDGEDAQQAVNEAWQIVDPDFALEESETLDIPPSAAGGVDEFILVNYESEEDGPIVQVEGRRYEGKVYVLIFILELEAYQQRTAQVQLIDSGFDITALEEEDLSSVEPLLLTDEVIAELETFIQAQMEALNVPGAAVAIVRDGQVVYANGFGVRDLETGEPVTEETLMMVGSTTKPVTTMLMAHLVDEGAFTWDTPVVEVLPSFEVSDPQITEQMTMRNLVCACTGVPRRDLEWLFNASEMNAEDIITSLADFEFFTDFGETFQYSNQMVATGGYVATLAAGGEMETLFDDYVALLQSRILDPLEMTSSTFSFDAVADPENHATPYGQSALGEMVALPLSTEAVLLPVAPAGAMWSNVLDMSQFVIANLQQGVAPNGERVVSEENLAVTWEPQVEISADADYGLGWIVEDYHGLQVLSHAGNTFGFTSELAFVPQANLGISILTNQQYSSLNQIVRLRLLELLYEQESSVEQLLAFSLQQSQEAVESLESSLTEVDPEAVAPYLGAYSHEVLGSVTLDWQGENLVLDAGEFQSVVRATAQDGEINYLTFTPPLAGLPLELSEDEAGNAMMVLGAGVVEYTFEKEGSD